MEADPGPEHTVGRWTRRRVLVGGGGTAALAWVAPSIVSVPAAHAQGSVLPGALRLIIGLTPVSAWYSDDGGDTSVSATTPPTGSNFLYGTDVASDGASRLVLAGWEQADGEPDTARAWTSVDHGVTWSALALPASVGQVTAVATDGAGTWVLGGVETSGFLRSTDGTTWSTPTTPPAPPATETYSGVCTNGMGLWVAVGDTAASTSADGGDTWNAVTTPPSGRARRVATDGAGTWVAVGHNPGAPATLAIWRSLDNGDTWTASTVPASTGTFNRVIHDSGATWLASAGTTVYRSVDGGATWAASPGQPPDANSVFGLASDGAGRWVASGSRLPSAGGGPNVWWSTDSGATWNEATAPPLVSNFAGTLAFDRLLP